MKVYKFGGASVRSAAGIRNISAILKQTEGNLFIVISAMGKTTNAMEVVLEHYMEHQPELALEKLAEVEQYHAEIITELFADATPGVAAVLPLFKALKEMITETYPTEYDKCYDAMVSYGELLSTAIISAYLKGQALDNCWLDMRNLLVTDSNFREANVRMEESAVRLQSAVDFSLHRIYIGQGFIGGNPQGLPTTLGREGSDYTAAVVGNLLDAESVTIWKDVPGILNADPRLFPNTVLIPELTYYDAVELAYSGAQIIHPKTIRPLENRQIPLYVKPFDTPNEAGSVIKGEVTDRVGVPVFILRKNQVLITISPRDFSFVLEESLSKFFATIHRHRLKVSLIQSSAVSISVCVDNTRYLSAAMDELQNEFRMSFNSELELLTIRGVTDESIEQTTSGKEVLLSQRTRKVARFVMKSQA